MATRLKIDLAQGVLEVEGSETFVKTIYADFKAHFVDDEAAGEPVVTTKPKRTRTRKSTRTRAKTASKKTTSKKSKAADAPAPSSESEPVPATQADEPVEPKAAKVTYTFIKDLNLGSANGRPSLVEFMDTKVPITNEERNLVFVHYLQHLLEVEPITIDHLYTCYKAAKIRAPLNIESSLQITANQRHWIKMTKDGSLSVTPAGKLYVEKQLPKKIKN